MWLILALITAVLWAIGSVLLKRAVGQMPKELVYLANAVYFWLFWLALLIINGSYVWSWLVVGLALFPGIGFIYALTSYEKADASLVSSIGSIHPALTALLAVSFLGEKLSGWQGLLIAFIVLGAVYMALPEKVRLKNTAWVWWGIGFGILSGLNNFLSKIGLNKVDTYSYTFTVASWQLLAALIWMTISGRWQEWRRIFNKKDRVGLIGTGIFNLGSVVFFITLGLGQASLVMPVVNLYVPLICVLAWVWLKERMTKRQIVGAGVILGSVIGLSILS